MTIRDGPLEKQVPLGGGPRRNCYSDSRAEKGLPILGKKQKLLFQIRRHICKLDEEEGTRTHLTPAADTIVPWCGFCHPNALAQPTWGWLRAGDCSETEGTALAEQLPRGHDAKATCFRMTTGCQA